ELMKIVLNQPADSKNRTDVPPNASINMLIGPFGDRNTFSMPTITTTEMKCGMYVIFCSHLLKFLLRISLTSRASIIGIGNAISNENKLIDTVFHNSLQK